MTVLEAIDVLERLQVTLAYQDVAYAKNSLVNPGLKQAIRDQLLAVVIAIQTMKAEWRYQLRCIACGTERSTREDVCICGSRQFQVVVHETEPQKNKPSASNEPA